MKIPAAIRPKPPTAPPTAPPMVAAFEVVLAGEVTAEDVEDAAIDVDVGESVGEVIEKGAGLVVVELLLGETISVVDAAAFVTDTMTVTGEAAEADK